MKNRVYVICIIMFLIFSSSCPIFAEDILNNNVVNDVQNRMQSNNVNELQTLYNEVQGQVTDANEQLENVQTGLSATMLQIENLNEKIDKYQAEIDSLGRDTKGLKNSIDQLEQELVIAEAKYNEKKDNLKKRLIALYETGETTYLDVLLNSKSITDFLSRYYFIIQIADYDSKLLEEAELEKSRIEIAKETLVSQRNKYKVAKDNTEKTAILLENTRIVKNSYINQLSEDEKILQQKIELYNQQIREIEAEIVMLTTANIGSDYIGGNFAWPVPGYSRITSPFGMRVHPITGVTKLHTGTDIGAPMGANFVAMNSGVVLKAGFNAAYGNMVIIDHGGGVATLYAHGSEILVSDGQYVNKGDPVLKVGNTGYSTGPHAHFEIRINGEYMDPMKYVSPDV